MPRRSGCDEKRSCEEEGLPQRWPGLGICKGIKPKNTKQCLHKPFEDVSAVLEDIKSFNENLFLCCLLTYGCLLRPHREIRQLTWGDIG